jgi:hypothetical protein
LIRSECVSSLFVFTDHLRYFFYPDLITLKVYYDSLKISFQISSSDVIQGDFNIWILGYLSYAVRAYEGLKFFAIDLCNVVGMFITVNA